MHLSIIISYYKNLDNLKLILAALDAQSCKCFEVIVSEDDNNQETIDFFAEHKSNYSYPIIHLNQHADIGFRKNMMLNKSIQSASHDMMFFLDGDCVPHKHFAKEYSKNAKVGYMFSGRRVMLNKKFSKKLLEREIRKIKLFALLFSNAKRIKDAVYFPLFPLVSKGISIMGCNWGVLKSHLIEVNGFDEDYTTASVGEDTDIEWRLMQIGLRIKTVRNKAIVYHLHHPVWYSEDTVMDNFKKLNTKKDKNQVVCLNGLTKSNVTKAT